MEVNGISTSWSNEEIENYSLTIIYMDTKIVDVKKICKYT